eukprot:272853_1
MTSTINGFTNVSIHTAHVHKRTERIVHGFIHQSVDLLMKIPDVVLTLCVLFYNANDYFAASSYKMKILSTSANYVKLVKQGMNWSTAIGNSCIDIARHPHQTYYEWTIISNSRVIFIGIDSTPNLTTDTGHLLDASIFNVYSAHKYYAWGSLQNSNSLLVTNDPNAKYSKSFKHGIRGKIKMIIDVRNASIIIIRDGHNLGVTFSNIDLTQKYHLAVCLYQKGSWCQVIDETNMHY